MPDDMLLGMEHLCTDYELCPVCLLCTGWHCEGHDDGELGRYRIMVHAPGFDPAEWVKIENGRQVPLMSLEAGQERLREYRQVHPDWKWWVEPAGEE
jgi:hypothetical protein